MFNESLHFYSLFSARSKHTHTHSPWFPDHVGAWLGCCASCQLVVVVVATSMLPLCLVNFNIFIIKIAKFSRFLLHTMRAIIYFVCAAERLINYKAEDAPPLSGQVFFGLLIRAYFQYYNENIFNINAHCSRVYYTSLL